jgi:hypothetical protein
MAKAAGVARDEAGSPDHDGLRSKTPSNRALFFTTTLISVPFVCLRPGLEEEPGLRSPRQ